MKGTHSGWWWWWGSFFNRGAKAVVLHWFWSIRNLGESLFNPREVIRSVTLRGKLEVARAAQTNAPLFVGKSFLPLIYRSQYWIEKTKQNNATIAHSSSFHSRINFLVMFLLYLFVVLSSYLYKATFYSFLSIALTFLGQTEASSFDLSFVIVAFGASL